MKRYIKLSLDDIPKIEKVYNYNFPEKYKNFLYKRFFIFEEGYDWKDFSEDNIKKIKTLITYPIEYIKEDIREVEWNDRWGIEPKEYDEKRKQECFFLSEHFSLEKYPYVPFWTDLM